MRAFNARRAARRSGAVLRRTRPLRDGRPIELSPSTVGSGEHNQRHAESPEPTQARPMDDTSGAGNDGSPRSSASSSANDETAGSGDSWSASESQRSVTSGIDLDEKTRQRILARSNLRRAEPRRPPVSSSLFGRTTDCSSTPAPISAGTGRTRPSDDKRNLRITTPRNSFHSQSLDQGYGRTDRLLSPPSSGLATRGTAPRVGRNRPSDEKAAFRVRRHTPRASPPEIDHNESRSNTPRSATYVEVTPSGISSRASDTDDALDSVAASMATNRNNCNHEQSLDAGPREGDLEARVVIDEEEPEILPGAFAVSGIGDDEEGHGISGYDSGFENDANSSFGETSENIMDLVGRDESLRQRNSDNPESGGPHDTVVDASNTPLQAELYEVEAPLAAEILIVEEDLDTPKKIRKLSVQYSFALGILLTITVVVLSRVVPQNGDVIDTESKKNGAPVVEGWRLVGGVLTVDDAEKDNIRFGNSVAISADGSRIAVGLPGSDNAGDYGLKSTGSVQVFDLLNGTKWEMVFEVFGMYSNAGLGTNVALSDDGTRVAIGAQSFDSDGTGYVVSVC